MHSFHLVFLTLWISTSTANPYPQDDLGEQRPNSNSLTTESDLDLGQLDLYVANEDNDNFESCHGDGTAKAIGKRGRACPVSGIQAPAKLKVGVPGTAVYAPPKPEVLIPDVEPTSPVQEEHDKNAVTTTEPGSGIPPNTRPPITHYYQGPCPWPVKFLCCLGTLMLPGQNLLGCWHCTSFSSYLKINRSFYMKPNTP